VGDGRGVGVVGTGVGVAVRTGVGVAVARLGAADVLADDALTALFSGAVAVFGAVFGAEAA
jgi:hypothetical protein